MTAVQIQVTDDDIDGADTCACHCPVARAARRAFESLGWGGRVYAHEDGLEVWRNGVMVVVAYPAGVEERITDFDNRDGLEPFEFTVAIPGL